MRVLHVVAISGRIAGATSVAISLANAMSRMAAVALLSSCAPTGKSPNGIAPGVVVAQGSLPGYGLRALFPYGDWNVLDIDGFGLPSIVHFHGVYNPVHARLAMECYERGIPYVVSPHGNLMREAQQYHGLKKKIGNSIFAVPFLRRSSIIHALGPEEKNDIVRLVGERVPVEVVPNGIQEESIDSVSRLRTGERSRQVVFLGRLDVHHKGLDLLLKAVGQCARVFRDRGASLVLVGPMNSRRDEAVLGRMILDLDIGDLVRVCGPRLSDEKWRTLREAMFFVHTSRYEGMPLAVLEAMAAGTPVLVTPGTNMATVTAEFQTGWVADPEVSSIAEAMVEALGTAPAAIEEKGARAQTLIQERFLFHRTVKGLWDMYESIRKDRQ